MGRGSETQFQVGENQFYNLELCQIKNWYSTKKYYNLWKYLLDEQHFVSAGAHPDNYDQNGKGPIHAAIAFPCMDMILLNLLIEAGCDPLNIEEFIRIMLETGILTPENMGVYLRKWYVTEKTNPKSLKRLCRHSIRGRLITLMRCQVQEEQPLQSACEKLPLPSIIQKYISVRFIEWEGHCLSILMKYHSILLKEVITWDVHLFTIVIC